ncbi:MAG: NUDIX hydrolase [Anaerolineae bacterium]
MEREYPSWPIVSVGVVVRKGSRVLLVRRGQEPRKGEWSIPGGIVELGETIRETARREVQEECGMEVQVGEVLDVIDAIYQDQEGRVRYHYVLVDLVATHLSGELKPGSDIDEARWVTREELDQFHLSEKTKSVILKALRDAPS